MSNKKQYESLNLLNPTTGKHEAQQISVVQNNLFQNCVNFDNEENLMFPDYQSQISQSLQKSSHLIQDVIQQFCVQQQFSSRISQFIIGNSQHRNFCSNLANQYKQKKQKKQKKLGSKVRDRDNFYPNISKLILKRIKMKYSQWNLQLPKNFEIKDGSAQLLKQMFNDEQYRPFLQIIFEERFLHRQIQISKGRYSIDLYMKLLDLLYEDFDNKTSPRLFKSRLCQASNQSNC